MPVGDRVIPRSWLLAVGFLLAPGGASALEIEMTVSAGGGVLCSGTTTGTDFCDVSGVFEPLTVTWSLDASTSLNGYDLGLSWNPDELSLIGSSQLLPDSAPPDTNPFLVAPDPGDPVGSSAVALELVAQPTTQLFSVTFDPQALKPDCQPDLVWVANGNGLSPGSAVLGNPGGAGIDFGRAAQCAPVEIPALAWSGGLALAFALMAAVSRRPPGSLRGTSGPRAGCDRDSRARVEHRRCR